jgi:Tfp pilus assembly protein PilN
MIEINLLPRSGKRGGRRAAGAGVGGVVAYLATATVRIRDPFLAGAVAAVLLGAAAVGGMYLRLTDRAAELAERELVVQQDSTRYATILGEKRVAEAQRDSILRQVEIIRSIDEDRFVWPHIMEEISRALPAYTWLTSVSQTSAVVSVAARPDSAQRAAARATGPAAGRPGPATGGAATAARTAGAPVAPPLQFRIVGQTVDIQALTRFMKLLEASAFIQHVQLARTDVATTDGKQVTEFQLDAQFEPPAPSAIRLVPVTLSVR